ncbi:MAG: glycosyltransferase family 4 protein [Saprospiraceae bacterium]|jgi:glycosyltransferase involved in cell wall biosynthesis|nr:glycosyltransferase family 4 protein [Saprospiraceae bacterium]
MKKPGNNPPHIGLVTNTSWNVWNFRRELVDALVTEGFNVTIFAPEDEFSDTLQSQGYRLILLRKLHRKARNPIRDISFLLELRKLFATENIDLALLYTIKPNIYGAIAAWTLGKPSICTLTGLGYSFGNKPFLTLGVQMLYKLSFRAANLVIFQNPDDATYFVTSNLVENTKIAVIPGSGVNVSDFYPISRNSDPCIRFLYTGRLLKDKGVIEFCEAASIISLKYPMAKFTLLGGEDDGNPAMLSDREWHKVYQNRQFVEIVGYQKNVRSFLETCDVYVMPSYREGLPKSTLEAMSMGKAIITTDVPGCRETVKHLQNGWLVKARSAQSLADAMESAILAGKEKLEVMGKISRKMAVEQFASHHIIQAYLGAIQRIFTSQKTC